VRSLCSVDDRPLIVQFAATNSADFSRAAELVAPFADGIDLNCGCPQRWALADGYGAALTKKPELVADMVHGARRQTSLPVSIKIRIHGDLRETVELCRRAESAGCGWITIHGRTTKQRAEPCNFDAIKIVSSSIKGRSFD
jgi:tRNA-dihydrouridine synthase 4